MRVPYGYLNREFETLDLSVFNEQIKTGDLTLGKPVRDFEKQLAEYTGSKFALGVANGTDALEIALHALNRLDDFRNEVIVPANTFVASVSAIVREGLRPIFCDVDDKFVLDAVDVAKRINDNTLAIMAVHFQGQPCDVKSLVPLAEQNDIFLIEDAAQALDASVDGKMCGTFGEFGCFSFHPQKNLNCLGDGGAIVANRTYEYLDKYRNHGMSSRDTYEYFGRNSRLDSLNALYLSANLPKLHEWNNRRIAVAKLYDDELSQINGIKIPPRSASERHTYHLYMIRVPQRDDLYGYLHAQGVDARIHYPVPLHLQNCSKYLWHKDGDFPNAERFAKEMISLPIHQFITDDEVNYVISKIWDFYHAV